MTPEDVDLRDGGETAFACRGKLGPHPTNGEMVLAYNGRFGPYVKCGEGKTAETRSLPAGVSPLDVTLPQALELLAQPKAQRRGFGAKREPLKVFEGVSPVTEQPIQVLRRPLRLVRDRRRDQRLAAEEQHDRRADARFRVATPSRPRRRRPDEEATSQSGKGQTGRSPKKKAAKPKAKAAPKKAAKKKAAPRRPFRPNRRGRRAEGSKLHSSSPVHGASRAAVIGPPFTAGSANRQEAS